MRRGLLWAQEGDAQGGGRAGLAGHPVSCPGRAQGRGVAGARLGDPPREGCWGGGGHREGGEPGLPLRLAYCCFLGPENGETLPGAGMRCSPGAPRQPDAEPSAPGSPLAARAHPGQPDAGSGARPSRRLGKQRRGHGGDCPGVLKVTVTTITKQCVSNFSMLALLHSCALLNPVSWVAHASKKS